MLYFYKSISPHPIENLHNYLDFFFTRMFDDTQTVYSHAYLIHPNFQGIIDTYKEQIDERLKALFNAYIGLATPQEKQIVKDAYFINNDIVSLSDATNTPIKYSQLPAGISTQIKSFYDELWGDSKILGYATVVNSCGTVKQHFNRFREVNEFLVCPFCGLESLLCEHDDGRDDYDHYLLKSQYPFISINFNNLFPMCHRCNSKNKNQKDLVYENVAAPQRRFYYPYSKEANHEINLNIVSPNNDLKDPTQWQLEVNTTNLAYEDCKETWKDVFNIETRYKATISKHSKFWKERIFSKHHNICKKNGRSYAEFEEDILDDFNDYLNISNGILMKSFNDFVINDPNCQANLTGILIV
ncbi:hypothetical protein [Flavobacterium sp. HNIBRBA15423]|uniref:hypothetical protein n=1 Tax=Flavobacterium sp. HNIBRBA15423 TaxID=3458683 RepID=UPI004044CBFC